MKKLLIIPILLLGVLIVRTPVADAHEIKRVDCVRYARMFVFVTGRVTEQRSAFLQCWVKAKAHLLMHPLPDWQIPATLRRIRECESGGDYSAQNSSSTASGAYQYLDSTWGGHMGYARAMFAPPRIQDKRAIRDFKMVGGTPWAASKHCWG